MQRIDENTYIDDSLVTCAEYQLFIDEMREQGKYYQTDHWTSYQFSEGQAKEPILGVRSSDAEAFCEWLTESQGKEWIFRLPIEKETDAFPLKSIGINPLGYWVTGEYYQNKFVWINSVPDNPRKIDRDDARNLVIRHNVAMVLHEDFESVFNLALNRPFNLDDIPDDAFNLDRDLNRYASENIEEFIEETIDTAIGRSFILDLDRNDVIKLSIDIFTLQERYAGRSPAFEGIRLVKERIR